MIDLNSLIPSNSGWVLGRAQAINDLGQIVGFGYYNGQTRAFLLNPTSKVIVLQPGPQDGIYAHYMLNDNGDTLLCNFNPGVLMVSGNWYNSTNSLIKFNLKHLPSNVSSAKLYLYGTFSFPSELALVKFNRVTSDWKPSTDYTCLSKIPSSVDMYVYFLWRNTWNVIDITQLYNSWQNNTFDNEGILLSPYYLPQEGNGINFHSPGYLVDPSLRPKLVLEISN